MHSDCEANSVSPPQSVCISVHPSAQHHTPTGVVVVVEVVVVVVVVVVGSTTHGCDVWVPTVSPGGLAKNGLHPHGETQSLLTGSHVIGVTDVHSHRHDPTHGVVVVLVVVVVVVG